MKLKASKKVDFQNMSVDNFMDNMDVDADSESEHENNSPIVKIKKKEKVKKVKNSVEVPKKFNQIKNGKDEPKSKKDVEVPKKLKKIKNGSDEPKNKKDKTKIKSKKLTEPQETDGKSERMEHHQVALEKLKDIDPEMYEFLKKNDKKLLKLGTMDDSEEDAEISDIELSEDEFSEDEEVTEKKKKVHVLPEKLEVPSDESDFEPDKDSDDDGSEEEPPSAEMHSVKVTLKLLKKWNEDLTSQKVTADYIRTATKAFNSALISVSGDTDAMTAYKVEGAAIFNGVIQLCVLHMQPAVQSFMSIKDGRNFKEVVTTRKFKKIRNCIRGYLSDLTNLIENVTSPNIMTVLLKHLHQFSPILVCFSSITKPILKRLIVIWSTSNDETIRVLAFLCILKITRGQQHKFLSDVLKKMYLSYVNNCKFVSPNTLPAINFMRRSVTEMFALDMNVSYQHVFLYIRQLAIHLRNAVVLQKKDSFRFVYNWQYINSMKLWADVLAVTHDKQLLQPLVYPLVSIMIGVIKLIPSAQYFPLRFHCCRVLVSLSARTRTFIPVLPFLLEVLTSKTFNEDHKKLSMKPINLACLLRFNASNIKENAFKDAVIENIYGLILEFMANESYSISFPDMAVPTIVALRAYSKETSIYKYSRKMKQLSDKIQENSTFVENERKKITFALKDYQLIQSWETTLRNKGTPLLTLYTEWSKENEKGQKRQASNSDDINDFDLPTIKKQTAKNRKPNEGPVVLFPSDDEDDSDINEEDMDEEIEGEGEEESAQPPMKKSKKEKTKKQSKKSSEEFPLEQPDEGEEVDIVKNLNLDDWD